MNHQGVMGGVSLCAIIEKGRELICIEPEQVHQVMDFQPAASAVAAFRRHFDVLADGITSIGPDRVNHRLCSRGLLPSDVFQHSAPDTSSSAQYSRALVILNAIEEALLVDPAVLRKFLKVFKKEKPLQQVSVNILSTYSE